MSRYVSAELRRLVAQRADYLCEYCLIAEADAFFGCEVDHIISEKHGGQTEAENLAYACVFCNRYKGSDIGSLDGQTGEYVRFYNPRVDVWGDHFALDGVEIRGLSGTGRVTVRLLQLNVGSRQLERRALAEVGRYPSAAALRRVRGGRA